MSTPEQSQLASSGRAKVFLQRTFSTVVLLGILAGVLIWNHEVGYYGLISLFCVLTAWEWRHMIKVSGKAGQANVAFWAGALYPVFLSVLCCCIDDNGALPHHCVMLAPAVVAIVAFIIEMKNQIEGSRSLRSVATTVLSFIYPGWMFSFAILAIYEGFGVNTGAVGQPFMVGLILWVVLVTKMSDIFAFVSGFMVGGRFFERKLIPHISPKKTWEGIIGSWIITNVAAQLMMVYWLGLPFDCTHVTMGILAVTIIFVLSVYGDLAGSLIKRSLNVKDSGALLPGIGGIYDLIDSPAFTVPVAWFVCTVVW